MDIDYSILRALGEFNACRRDTRDDIIELIEIIDDEETTEDEKHAAYVTIHTLLFDKWI